MIMQITESADENVDAGRPFKLRIADVKSEDGRVYKFKGYETETNSKILDLTRRPVKSAVQSKAQIPLPPSPPFKEDGDAADKKLTKWLVGNWRNKPDGARWEWRFLDLGHYNVKVTADGKSLGSFDGQWFVRAGQLTLTVEVSFYPAMKSGTTQTFKLTYPEPDALLLWDHSDMLMTWLLRVK